MAEVALAGKGGSVYIPGTPTVPIAQVSDWTCQMDADNYDASVLGDSWRHFVPGLRGWQGRISGYYDFVQDTTGQFTLLTAYMNSNPVVVIMQTAPGGGQFEGTVNITQISVADSVRGLITAEFTYVGTGSLQHLP
jgi:ABC-type nitrate/sulfonate/bicarbonate transport system substrate-binding protein